MTPGELLQKVKDRLVQQLGIAAEHVLIGADPLAVELPRSGQTFLLVCPAGTRFEGEQHPQFVLEDWHFSVTIYQRSQLDRLEEAEKAFLRPGGLYEVKGQVLRALVGWLPGEGCAGVVQAQSTEGPEVVQHIQRQCHFWRLTITFSAPFAWTL